MEKGGQAARCIRHFLIKKLQRKMRCPFQCCPIMWSLEWTSSFEPQIEPLAAMETALAESLQTDFLGQVELPGYNKFRWNQIGLFLKDLDYNITYKSSPKLWWLWGLLGKTLSKNWFGYLSSSFCKNWASFDSNIWPHWF